MGWVGGGDVRATQTIPNQLITNHAHTGSHTRTHSMGTTHTHSTTYPYTVFTQGTPRRTLVFAAGLVRAPRGLGGDGARPTRLGGPRQLLHHPGQLPRPTHGPPLPPLLLLHSPPMPLHQLPSLLPSPLPLPSYVRTLHPLATHCCSHLVLVTPAIAIATTLTVAGGRCGAGPVVEVAGWAFVWGWVGPGACVCGRARGGRVCERCRGAMAAGMGGP